MALIKGSARLMAPVERPQGGHLGHGGNVSFYPTKNLGALGDGGAITTSDPSLAERVRLLRQYGWTSKYQSVLPAATVASTSCRRHFS